MKKLFVYRIWNVYGSMTIEFIVAVIYWFSIKEGIELRKITDRGIISSFEIYKLKTNGAKLFEKIGEKIDLGRVKINYRHHDNLYELIVLLFTWFDRNRRIYSFLNINPSKIDPTLKLTMYCKIKFACANSKNLISLVDHYIGHLSSNPVQLNVEIHQIKNSIDPNWIKYVRKKYMDLEDHNIFMNIKIKKYNTDK